MRISSAPWKNKTKNLQPQRETLRSKVLASMNGRFCSLDVVCRVFESSFFLCPKMQFWGILDKQSDWLALGKQNVCTNISVWSHWVAKLADKSEHSENRRACWKKKVVWGNKNWKYVSEYRWIWLGLIRVYTFGARASSTENDSIDYQPSKQGYKYTKYAARLAAE